MVGTEEETMAASTVEEYQLLQDAYKLSKQGWTKLRTYPVLSSMMPLAESTTALALGKAGLDIESIEQCYIWPTLSKLDAKYVSKVASSTLKTVENTKASVKAAGDGLGSRKEVVDEYAQKVATSIDTTKHAVLRTKEVVVEKYDTTKDAVVEKYDVTKEAILGVYYKARASVEDALAKTPETAAE